MFPQNPTCLYFVVSGLPSQITPSRTGTKPRTKTTNPNPRSLQKLAFPAPATSLQGIHSQVAHQPKSLGPRSPSMFLTRPDLISRSLSVPQLLRSCKPLYLFHRAQKSCCNRSLASTRSGAPGNSTRTMADPLAAKADPSSFSNPHEVAVRHSHFELSVDFGSKFIDGYAQVRPFSSPSTPRPTPHHRW